MCDRMPDRRPGVSDAGAKGSGVGEGNLSREAAPRRLSWRYQRPDKCGWNKRPPVRKLDGICQQGKERLHAGCDGGGQGLRIACCVVCGNGAVRAALARKGRMKTRRVRAAAPQGGQHVVVAPECPGLRQRHSELTGCDMCAERSMYQQPGADRGVQPKQAGGRVLEQDETAMCTDKGEKMSGTAMERR